MDHEQWIRRQLEIDYWRLVNMRADLAELDRQIAEYRRKVAAWNTILTPQPESPR